MMRALLLAVALVGVGAPTIVRADDAPVCRRKKKKTRRTPRRKGKRAPKAASAAAPKAPTTAPASASGPTPSLRRSNRMEFDARLVKGEKATGAVYLFRRVPRPFPPLLQLQQSPLDRIVRPVLHRGLDAEAAPPSEAPR